MCAKPSALFTAPFLRKTTKGEKKGKPHQNQHKTKQTLTNLQKVFSF